MKQYTTKQFNNDLHYGGVLWQEVKTATEQLNDDRGTELHWVAGPPA